MSDLKVSYKKNAFDIVFSGSDIEAVDNLETSVLVSIFTNARHENEGGCWIDSFEGFPLGSKLWLISREKKISEVTRRANEYIKESLSWLIEGGIAKTVNVDCYLEGQNILQIPIEITKPTGELVKYKFQSYWSGLE